MIKTISHRFIYKRKLLTEKTTNCFYIDTTSGNVGLGILSPSYVINVIPNIERNYIA